jgi:D-lactate dehydrogenase (cytochrome)
MALADIKSLQRNTAGIESVIGVLKQRFGERLQTSQSLLEQHSHTTTYLPSQLPDAVVFPHSTTEVQEIVQTCAKYKVPIIPYGTGTSLEGGVNAPEGGISVDLQQMDKIVAVHNEDLDCVVQPGVTREALNVHLRDTGLFFPIDPGANASLGGMAATRASGTNAVRYGTMRENVINITAVLPDGRIIKTANRAKKSAAGYDMTRLFVGAEGTLGIITELTVKLYGIPEAISAAICRFPTVEDACNTTILAMQTGIPMARIELLDALAIKACNNYSDLGFEEVPTLFIEFHGSEAGVREQTEMFGEIAKDFGGSDFDWVTATEDRNRLWKARHNFAFAVQTLRPGKQIIATDACVPISRLADCLGETLKDIEEVGLIAPIVGHVGDGNIHVTPLVDVNDPEEVKSIEAFLDRLNKRAISMDGTCTGEHGIGQGKRRYLEQELGETADLMIAIKKSFDPDNIMNPGKVVSFE